MEVTTLSMNPEFVIKSLRRRVRYLEATIVDLEETINELYYQLIVQRNEIEEAEEMRKCNQHHYTTKSN